MNRKMVLYMVGRILWIEALLLLHIFSVRHFHNL